MLLIYNINIILKENFHSISFMNLDKLIIAPFISMELVLKEIPIKKNTREKREEIRLIYRNYLRGNIGKIIDLNKSHRRKTVVIEINKVFF